jgi:hypothetical protein
VDAPFFIVGSARSGTTLLRLILNAHPAVAVPPESRFITELFEGKDEVEVEDFLSRLDRHQRFALWDLPIELVRAEFGDERSVPYRSAVEAPFRAFMHTNSKVRWGDKTPRYVEHMPFIHRLWDGARFIHLIRDGREVALSYADVPFGPKTVGRAAALWARRVSTGRDAGAALPDGTYLEVRYETLVSEPETTVREIARFLDLDFDPGMLDDTKRAQAAVSHRSGRFNPNVTRPPGPGRRWQERMSDGDVEVFEAVAGGLLDELGFERRFPSPRVAARARAVLSSWGFPIARLKPSH